VIGRDDEWGCRVGVLIQRLHQVQARYPDARVLINNEGNLVVVHPTDDGRTGQPVGTIRFGNGLTSAGTDPHVDWD
jgi:hypothetical protein